MDNRKVRNFPTVGGRGALVIWIGATQQSTKAPTRCTGCNKNVGLLTEAQAQDHANNCED